MVLKLLGSDYGSEMSAQQPTLAVTVPTPAATHVGNPATKLSIAMPVESSSVSESDTTSTRFGSMRMSFTKCGV